MWCNEGWGKEKKEKKSLWGSHSTHYQSVLRNNYAPVNSPATGYLCYTSKHTHAATPHNRTQTSDRLKDEIGGRMSPWWIALRRALSKPTRACAHPADCCQDSWAPIPNHSTNNENISLFYVLFKKKKKNSCFKQMLLLRPKGEGAVAERHGEARWSHMKCTMRQSVGKIIASETLHHLCTQRMEENYPWPAKEKLLAALRLHFNLKRRASIGMR